MAQAEMIIRIWTRGRRKLPDDLPEAFAPHAEHIHSQLESGHVAGQICDDRFEGWWEIKS